MQAVAPTISDAVWPRVGLWRQDIARDMVLMMGFAWFVALSAQIAIRLPWTTVPITGQTFAVLVTGGALGAWRGAGALTVYMVMGMIYIPVFAPGNSATSGNWDVHFIFPWKGSDSFVWDISGGGYIVGFIIAAWLVGYLAERQWDRKPWVHLGMFLGNVSLYVPGLLWLGYLIGTDWMTAGKPLGEWIAGDGTLDKTLKGGLYPFIVGDMMKLLLASVTLPAAWALVQRYRRTDHDRPR